MNFRSSSFGIILVVFLLTWHTQAQDQTKVFNVMDYNAVADGSNQNNSEAFLKAWDEACQWKGNSRVYIPKGTYFLNHVIFKGPCNGHMEFVIQGVLKAPTNPSLFLITDKWINFQHVSSLILNGGGTLDSQGAAAWPLNDCNKKQACKTLPTAMRFDFVNDARVESLKSLNSKNAHFILYGCKNMQMSDIEITAPGNSPNTDGIKIAQSQNIKISRTKISTGDDCVAMLPGISDIEISEVACGPGHGISIGSLARTADIEPITRITVKNCSFHGSSNGIRLKTWASPYKGTVSNLVYEDIVMNDVQNPIIIDQNYCPYDVCDHKASSHVQISNMEFKNIRGTSSSQYAVTLKCSQACPCQNVRLEDINLMYKSLENAVGSWCSYARGVAYGMLRPPSCM